MATISWLEENNLDFPLSEFALKEPNGLLAAGGDLSSERLISAYRKGIFPWYEDHQPIMWWSPSPRAVLYLDKLKVSRSLNKRIKRQEFQISCDSQFLEVMRHCANTPRHGQAGTWITEDMVAAYAQLHNDGIAHSVEAWFQGSLVGGLYGLAIGKVFFGESMFSLKTDASKVAFAHLVSQLQAWGFALIDCQVSNSHLLSLGAEEIDRLQFEKVLAENIDKNNIDSWKDHWHAS
jgi:leucyl/phenylalanyl-tRNA--protein transferase